MNRWDPDPTTEDAATLDEDALAGAATNLPPKVASLRFKLGQKAKQEPEFRFYALYGHLLRVDVLETAFGLVLAKRGRNTPGVDSVTADRVVATEDGAALFLEGIRQDLRLRTFRPSR